MSAPQKPKPSDLHTYDEILKWVLECGVRAEKILNPPTPQKVARP